MAAVGGSRTVTANRSHFGAEFARCEDQLAGSSPPWLAPVRRAAIERFDELGLPTRKDEPWKYTPTTRIAKATFSPSSRSAALSRSDIARLFGNPAVDCSLVFVDGRFARELSSTDSAPKTVFATSLADVLRDDPQRVQPVLSIPAESLTRPFAALNLAFVDDGAFVSIDAGLGRKSIELLFVSTPAAGVANIRNIIRLSAGAEAVISIRYASQSDLQSESAAADSNPLTNAFTSIELGDNAQLDLISLQAEAIGALHLSSIDVEQRRDSRFRSHSFALGGGLARSEVNTVLTAPGADCELDGLFLVGDDQHVDNQTVIDHASPRCTSRELYKGVLGGRSRGVFNGLVRVRRDAQKTDARQSNPNLLVSDRAHVNTKPTLEIYADDVKCSHGSTIGRIDEDALFYLRSRGLDERTATELLIGAFVSELTDAIPHESIRACVRDCVTAKLAAVTRAEVA